MADRDLDIEVNEDNAQALAGLYEVLAKTSDAELVEDDGQSSPGPHRPGL